MLSSASIAYIREEAGRKAKRAHKKPQRAEIVLNNWETQHRFTFPFLGDYVPEGWQLCESIEPLLVDKTGRGREYELALTWEQFARRIRDFALARDNYALAILEEGQSQIVVGIYQPARGDFTHSGELTERELRQVKGS